jgi:2-dehydro-3-deoxygluconokinase
MIALEDGERSFAYWRGQSAARRLADDPGRLAAAMASADLIYLSGITLAILEPPARQRLLDALRDARADGRRVAFDTNLRPRLWSDPAEMTAAVTDCAGLAEIVLPSFDDEARWFGDPDPAATAARYAGAGARIVVVKDGPRPVRWRVGDAAGTVPVPPAPRVVDTTAAGDSFNAGVLARLNAGAPIADAVERGNALAGQVVQARGALVPVTV